MKRILSLLLLLNIIISLSSCGASLTSDSSDIVVKAPSKTYSLSASFDTRMFMGSSVLKVGAGQDNAQKVWYGGKCWYVIGYDGSNMVTAESGAVTLLYSGSDESSNFNGEGKGENANAYSGSHLEKAVNSLCSKISATEQKGIITRSIDGGSSNYDQPGYNANNVKGSSVNGSLWPLSAIEAGQLGKVIKTAGGKNWWLRSPGNEDDTAQYMNSDGNVVSSGSAVTDSLGVRPAFYLNNSAILFTSSADSGKTTDEWKVTLRDDGSVSGLSGHKSFSVTNASSCDGKILFVSYSGAATGGSEYISAIIVNGSGDIKYYERLEQASSASGTIAFNIESGIGSGDTLYLFNEQFNGDKKTSFSSDLKKVSIPSASGHSWSEATCTDPKTCSVCGATEGSALGHDWHEATCTEAKKCTRCGATEGSAKGHNWEIVSCTEPRKCSVCGAQESSIVGHDWKDATCTEPKTCKRCKTTEGEALGHNWQEASCTEPKTCARCKATEGSALGHNWIEATCTVPRHCDRCGIADGDPLGHDWKIKSCTEPRECSRCGGTDGVVPGHDWKDATCTEPKTCQRCKATEGDPLGHKWKEATCTEPKTCEVCHATEGKALGHTPGDAVKENEKAATCEGKGSYDNVVYCKVCKAEISRNTKTTAPLGHDWNNGVVTKKPTCEKAGVTTYTCKNDSDHTKTEKIKALGHDWDAGTITKKATCEEEGEKTYTCKNDSKHTKTEKIKATGHSWNDGEITKKPTCEEDGEKTFTCKNDSKHTKKEKVKATGHNWNEGAVTKEPTCVESGEKTFTCKNDSSHTKKEKIDALGHDWGEWKTTTAPGVNKEGESTRYCNRCGVSETKSLDPLNGYVLTFDSNGGSAVPSQNVVDGTKPVRPQDPVREGYTFTGWYSDSSCNTPFDFSKDLTGHTTVYAGWAEKEADIPDTEPDTPDNENKTNPLIWLVLIPVVLIGVGAGFVLSKKRTIQK